MPRILSRQPYKGTFIHDQQMFWLDLPEDRRAEGMEPEIFRLAGVSDKESTQVLASSRLKRNPWREVERYDVLQKGQRLNGTPWQYLCVTVGAGTGKTMAMEQTEYLLAHHDPQILNIFLEFTQIRNGVNSIMGTSKASAMSDHGTPLLIRELQKITVNGQHIPGADAWDMLQRKIQQGKLTLVIDALDQFGGKLEVARASTVALREFLQRYPQVRCVISGRQFAVKRYWEQLFAPLNWDFVQLGTFTEEQCIRRVGQERWNYAKRLGNVSMSVPRWLDVLRDISDLTLLKEEIRSLSELYLRSLESLIKAARIDQPDALREDRAWYLFSLLAFEMMTDPNGPYRGQSAGIDNDSIGKFKLRIWDDRAVRQKQGTYRLPGLETDIEDFGAFDSMLGQLGALNEMLDNPVIAGTPEDPAVMTQIFWRDQTLQDMFTALWMTRWATDVDRQKLRSTIPVRWRTESEIYQDMWRLATEMRAGKNGRKDEVYAATMCLLLEPGSKEKIATRSTEMIWRVWDTMESISEQSSEAGRIAKAGIYGFLQEYVDILDGCRGDEAQRICKDFETWFEVAQLIYPGKATWTDGGLDDEGKRLPIISRRYRMAKYTVTNELFELFDADLQKRYVARGREWGVDFSKYQLRGRVPVVAVDWYDAWCLATWLGSSLPTESEWEYACRAGQRSRYSVGDGKTLTPTDARFGLKWQDLATEVDAFPKGNAWGLYQMHGNVLEWCEDWRDDEDRSSRCLRGGSFDRDPELCRSADRFRRNPTRSYYDFGVRVSRAASD